MRQNRLRLPSAVAALALAAGCTVGPDYVRPTIETPAAFRGAQNAPAPGLPAVDTRWWEQFGDPVLNDLVSASMRENKDLLIAASRVEEFAARYGIARSDLAPQVGVGGGAGRQQTSESGANPTPSSYKSTSDSYSATLNASWELDLWGRVRRGGEAAKAQFVSTEEGRQAVVLSLVTSVANAYVNLRSLDRQLEIAKATADSRGKTLELFRKKFAAGVVSEMELTQSKTLYDDSLASLPGFEKAIGQQENGLNVLLGRNPGPIPRGKTIEQLVMPVVPAGIPSELLARRPDIREAEQNLIAANAQIGVAKAAYFPSITLTASAGSASSDLSNLFSGPAKMWSFGSSLTAPIFNAGKIEGNVKVTEAQRNQALASYQKTIQNAFREVEDALVGQTTTRQQLGARSLQVDDTRKYLKLANLRYEGGYSNYLEVLDAERSCYGAQLGFVQNQGALFQSLIDLYKAMGGGWVKEADGLTPKPGA